MESKNCCCFIQFESVKAQKAFYNCQLLTFLPFSKTSFSVWEVKDGEEDHADQGHHEGHDEDDGHNLCE